MSFNKIFRKGVTYDNIKSHKNPWLHHLLRDTFFEKPQGGQINPTTISRLDVLRLIYEQLWYSRYYDFL